MSVLEILEAHTGRHFDDDGMRVYDCGYYLGAEDTIYNRVSARHRAHVAEILDQHMREREAEAWQTGVTTALNHAIQNPDGITLRLEHLDGRPWANPYKEES